MFCVIFCVGFVCRLFDCVFVLLLFLDDFVCVMCFMFEGVVFVVDEDMFK